MMRNFWLGALVLLVLVSPARDSLAIRLGAGPAADRSSAQPLRAMDMAAVLSASSDQEWRLAASKLPERCRQPEILDKKDCDDDLRCGWLAARAAIARAWSGEVVRGKADAAAFLHRASRRMAVGGLCSKKGNRQSVWDADRKRAAEDDALVHLALLVEHESKFKGHLLPARKEERVRALIAQASEQGLGKLDRVKVASYATDLHMAWLRGSWLHAHPVVSRLRTTIPRLWEGVGPIPEGCGEELARPELLDDQWRGYLVREVISKALVCVAERLPEAMARKGMRLENPGDARIVARGLATVASRDRGGRNFSRDAALLARIDELEGLYRPTQVARTSPRKAERRPPSKRKVAKRANRPRAGGGASKQQPAARTRTKAARPAQGRSDLGLVRLARRVGEVSKSSASLVGEARKAHSEAARSRVVEHMVIAAHRALCAPLAEVDQEDLEAVRKILVERGFVANEGSCDATEGRDSLEDLLEAAPGLEKLASAARMRTAAREVASEHPVRALKLLDSVSQEARGTTWVLLYAWAARLDGDPVTADRMLARLDEDTLDRLRAAGSEEVARIVAHAWVSKAP